MFPKKMEQFLENLPLGAALRKIFTILLWAAAVLFVFAGLYFVMDMAMTLPDVQHPAAAIGTIVAVLITIAGTCLLVMLVLYRVQGLERASVQDYPVAYLSALLFRLAGEVLAVFHVMAGLSAGIVFWFGSYPHLPYFKSLMWRILTFAAFPSFISGLFAILASAFQAALTLLACYLTAELLLLLRDIPLKTRR